MTRAEIVGGQLTVRGEGTYLVDDIGSALGVDLQPTRSTGETDYYGGALLGIRFTVTVRPDRTHELSYLADDDAFVPDASLVSLDFHLQRLLAAAGLTAETKPTS